MNFEDLDEPSYQLEYIAEEDGRDVDSYTLQEKIEIAQDVLDQFHEKGHAYNEELIGLAGKEAQAQARREVRAIKRWLKEVQ